MGEMRDAGCTYVAAMMHETGMHPEAVLIAGSPSNEFTPRLFQHSQETEPGVTK